MDFCERLNGPMMGDDLMDSVMSERLNVGMNDLKR